ncbi:3-oxoacyl-ACP synthase III family protein [Maricaulis sp.]|uniref:3-oxoacyl-ACP synthase III family protein n=1 Tax=Maricaulis sp. TaxID=1486257 RepID=UPI001B0EEB4A|nr:ketoacyl-ACP synthase III [Maricaulis sp.]MBO6798497.1 ketoacyl-ACP synthase III [Maricaulis sp.]
MQHRTAGHGSAAITGTGIFLPGAPVRSDELDQRLGMPRGWLEEKCGVQTRHYATEADSQESMGVAAAHAALTDAGIEPGELDLLIFCGAVGRQPVPATAPLIKRELGLSAHAFPAYDVNATCLGTLLGLDHAAMAIATGRARTVLVVVSEMPSQAIPWKQDPATAGLFGDGAAALVVQAGSTGDMRLGPLLMETHADGYEYCQVGSGGTRYNPVTEAAAFEDNAVFSMDGKGVFRLSSKTFPRFLEQVLDKTGWSLGEVDLVVPHQASPHAISLMVKRCGIRPEQIFDVARTMGNQVAASLPIALHQARLAGRIQSGMKILMAGTSAGISLGAMAVTT